MQQCIQQSMESIKLPVAVLCGRCGKPLKKIESQIVGLGAGCRRITKGTTVTGNNTLVLNDPTMAEAVQHYLNTVVLQEKSRVRVTAVKSQSPGQTIVSFTSDDKETPDGK